MYSPSYFQIISGTILSFCTIYLILSVVYPISYRNVIHGRYLAGVQIPIQKLLNETEQQSVPVSSTLSTKSFVCDYKSNQSQLDSIKILSFESHLLNALRPYCDIVPTPRNRWISARHYVESDIVFIIYTGANFYQTRATAIRDTWLSRVTHKYFFSSTPYSPLPVTVIEGAGEDYASNMKKLYKGIKIAYEQHNQTGKFYYLAGCDTFVNVPHILKRLENFDYRQSHLIGGHPFDYPCFRNKQEIMGIKYPSGGAGFFLSAGLMKTMYSNIESFFVDHWPTGKASYSDVAISCLANSLGVKPSFVPGFWAFTPEQTFKDTGKQRFHADQEPNTFHYVQPKSMYILDEFYIFQHIDRLANDRNLDELVQFTRLFVAAHYQLLRIKQQECTLPEVKPVKK